jgi:uncharacterized protein (DUF1499 family)
MRTTLLYASYALVFTVLACAGSRPANLGVKDQRLAPCPDSPNCVSSQTKDSKHHIEPLHYDGTQEEARERLLAVLQGMKRSKIVTNDGHYIHIEFTSAVFRFVDDTEFFFDDAKKAIVMRSAARLGYYDFGVNRKRLEAIRSGFVAQK